MTTVNRKDLVALAAWSVEQAGLILQPVPSGDVEVRLVGGSSNVIASGPKHPVIVHGGFSLNIYGNSTTQYFERQKP